MLRSIKSIDDKYLSVELFQIKVKSLKIILIGVLLIFSCSQNPQNTPNEKILAKIGDKTISVNEFIRRAEYTKRPNYCRGNNYIHKKIILNSLIAEKLLALEVGENNKLSENEQFQNYMRGRKEQAMRQWLYFHDFYNKVKVDSNEVKKTYDLSNRKYKIAYYTIKDSTISRLVKNEIDKGVSFTDVFKQFGGLTTIPQREVCWDRSENEQIIKNLYANPVKQYDVIGPIKIEENFYTIIKILGWTDDVVITDQDIRERWKNASVKVREQKANLQYNQYVKKIMKGKNVNFYGTTFFELVNYFGPQYLKSSKDKEKAFNRNFWNQENDDFVLEHAGENIQKILDQPLLDINGEIWTVADFGRELNAHPLVFRKRRIKKNEFAEQFKLAIIDMIRDKYITEDAYNKGYDKVNIVQRNEHMWTDYLNSLYQKNKYLDSIGKKSRFYKEYLQVIEDDLNPYIDTLQKKYSDLVEIDTDQFEKIRLTNIDMFVIQKNVPYPIIVPGFPIITTDNKLDYGRKKELSDFE